ncbi:hypothetical protein IFM89_024475 [Coptis chinensis]|uniref:Uncharacterized protein n=1 Tax=Coptis chinensis TaxID=261450 RepID=A0A835H8Q1_9MAGN|nr:hypothetical protein IFM89_024475 [Coptis chinensis]
MGTPSFHEFKKRASFYLKEKLKTAFGNFSSNVIPQKLFTSLFNGDVKLPRDLQLIFKGTWPYTSDNPKKTLVKCRFAQAYVRDYSRSHLLCSIVERDNGLDWTIFTGLSSNKKYPNRYLSHHPRTSQPVEIPTWKEHITIVGLLASALLGTLFCVITHKLNLTVGVIPSLNVVFGLLGFFLVKSWTRFYPSLVFLLSLLPDKENLIQTCVVACYGLAFSGK